MDVYGLSCLYYIDDIVLCSGDPVICATHSENEIIYFFVFDEQPYPQMTGNDLHV